MVMPLDPRSDEPFRLLNVHTHMVPIPDDGFVIIDKPDIASALDTLHADVAFDAVLIDSGFTPQQDETLIKCLHEESQLQYVPLIMHGKEPTGELLKTVLKHPVFHYIPADAAPLTQQAIVSTAAATARRHKLLQRNAERAQHALNCMEQSCFTFQSIYQARDLAYFLSQTFPEPERVVIGLAELMMNAIEHGNLGIDYEEKKDLVLKNIFYEEIERRVSAPEYANLHAHVHFTRTDKSLQVMVADQGKGFAWRDYLNLSSKRIFDPVGRGIAMAREFSFDELEYNAEGNMVFGTVYL